MPFKAGRAFATLDLQQLRHPVALYPVSLGSIKNGWHAGGSPDPKFPFPLPFPFLLPKLSLPLPLPAASAPLPSHLSDDVFMSKLKRQQHPHRQCHAKGSWHRHCWQDNNTVSSHDAAVHKQQHTGQLRPKGAAASVSTEAYRSCQEKSFAPLREPELRFPLPTPFLFPVFWLPFRFLHARTSHHQSWHAWSIGNPSPPSSAECDLRQ